VHRRSALLLVVACCLLLAGCPTDGGSKSALSSTTTSAPGAPTTTRPGGTAPGESVPGADGEAPERDPRVDADVPANVVIGGAKLQAVATGTGTVTDIERPALGNGLQVIGLLERAQGLVVVVRGPLPQDPGAVYVLGDDTHEPRSIGVGVGVVAGPTDHELWVVQTTGADGLTPVRRVDVGQEAPPLAQKVPRGRTLAGYGAGGLVLAAPHDAEEDVLGPIDVMDPTKGTLTRHLADSGFVVATDGQRAVVVSDGACERSCTVHVVTDATDRPFPLPGGVVPEPGGVTSAASTVFVARSDDGPRHVWVLSHTDGAAHDTGLTLPPEAGFTPMAMDAQGAWAFVRSGPSTLVSVRTEGAQAEALPWPLEPWGSIAVSNGGVCPCRSGGGSGSPVV
jgi:hypothetical protein